jgi:hypothetical protein
MNLLSSSSSLRGMFIVLVNKSDKLLKVLSFAMRTIFSATDSLAEWYEMLCCFLDSTDSGREAFL